ncbi:MAG: Crp/Fnr family transcriptional regulator [Planctomycetota bacterium]
MPEASDEAKKKLLRQLQCRKAKGEEVFHEGDTTQEMYILLKGKLEIHKGEQVIATIEEPDTYIGEMSTLLGAPRSATVVAAEDSILVRVPRERIAAFFDHSSALALKLCRILAQRLQDMNVKHEKLLRSAGVPEYEGVRTYERLVATPARRKFLSLVARNIGDELPLDQVADKLGVSSAEAGRIFTDFSAAKLVTTQNGACQFLDPPTDELRSQIELFAANPQA